MFIKNGKAQSLGVVDLGLDKQAEKESAVNEKTKPAVKPTTQVAGAK